MQDEKNMIAFRVPQEFRDRLTAIATDQDRSVASLCRVVLGKYADQIEERAAASAQVEAVQ